ncbi:MAG TPA: P1 family peptidase, partial [Mucilaginibacter sp.]|nr:P1 family peptidase [Mucilaginibacter sp.]
WFVDKNWYGDEKGWYTYPVVAETWDGMMNDIYGFQVKESNVYEAMNTAASGPVKEGNVGGGTGMCCLGFKGGSGTSSRIVTVNGKQYTLGAFVQSNFGRKKNLTIAGVPVGQELKDTLNYDFRGGPAVSKHQEGDGSIIVVIATDAPLLPHQLKRIAERVALGVGRVGGRGENGSGDIFIAFSTANPDAFSRTKSTQVEMLPNDQLNPLYEATVQSVEEAIINAMVAADTMEGVNGNKAYALPHDAVIRLLRKHGMVK